MTRGMVARWRSLAARCMAAFVAGFIGLTADAAGYRTANFLVDAPTEALARKIGDAAEQDRCSTTRRAVRI